MDAAAIATEKNKLEQLIARLEQQQAEMALLPSSTTTPGGVSWTFRDHNEIERALALARARLARLVRFEQSLPLLRTEDRL